MQGMAGGLHGKVEVFYSPNQYDREYDRNRLVRLVEICLLR